MPLHPSCASVHLRALAMIVACATLVACAPPPEVPAPGPEWKLSTRVLFVENDYVTPRTAPSTTGFRLSFQMIGGGLFGTITNPDVARVPVAPDYTFVLDLTGTAAEVRDAARLAKKGRRRDVEITPASLRMARVSIRTVDERTRERIGYSTWTDISTGEHFAIAWFDQPGRIAGPLDLHDGADFDYDVRVEKAGYRWLRFREMPDGTTRLESAAPPRDLVMHVTALRD